MPSDESLLQQAEEWKTKGNESFQKNALSDAISSYSQGIVAVDRIPDEERFKSNLKSTLLSNRAMCHLKTMQLRPCIEDCTSAVEHLEKVNTTATSSAATTDSNNRIRSKVLFRRAKARFLLASMNLDAAKAAGIPASMVNSSDNESLLQDAGKDLLTLLQYDPKNTEANQLLMTIRALHKSNQTASTPVSKCLSALKKADLTEEDQLHQVKILLGLLENDLLNSSMELGRLDGIEVLMDIVRKYGCATDGNDEKKEGDGNSGGGGTSKLPVLAMQCVSQSASYPKFVRAYLMPPSTMQRDLLQIVKSARVSRGGNVHEEDVIVSAVAVYVRVILHADRDDPNKEIENKTVLEHDTIVKTITTALQRCQQESGVSTLVIRAVLDMVGSWTAGTDRDATIRQALLNSSFGGTNITDPTVPIPKTQMEIHAMTPRELADHRKREHEKRKRDEAWAYERSRLIIATQECIKTFFKVACKCDDHIVRREMTVVLGKLLAAIQEDDKIKDIVKPLLGTTSSKDKDCGVIIEEVYDEDEAKMPAREEVEVVPLEVKMSRALITNALLLSKKEVGSWALAFGWEESGDELPDLINSGDDRAMCLASEVASAAAAVESSRHTVTSLLNCGVMEKLLKSEDRDIRSGAASAVAKLGLADKEKDEVEFIELLQAACDLLEDEGDIAEQKASSSSSSSSSSSGKDKVKSIHLSSYATSSLERAVEMLTYLVANTDVKEELAAGFKGLSASQYTALERLVKTTDIPRAGESLMGFGLASIFQNMAVTNLQLRREGFEGKEVTMEQYDELQKLGKTQDEKEVMESKNDPDTQESCNARIRKMGSANVPRALVSLMEGASETTLEQIVMAFNRMAVEPSVRGIMIQQGVLTSCIKVEKKEGPTETDTMKKIIKLARHCIAKMLVTTNPSLLTSAQRLGSIKPLIQLIRDIKSSDLQKFEALMAVTNIASSGEDAQNRIVSERGISTLNFAMFDEHEEVRRAATEAICNLVPHKAVMDYLAVEDNLRLWLSFAADYEDNYECSRAASGCLAMATQDPSIALQLVGLPKFRELTTALIECGRLEIMHRAFVMVHNLVLHGGKSKEKTVEAGLVAFCTAYADSYHNNQAGDIDFSEQEKALLPVTADLAKQIIRDAS